MHTYGELAVWPLRFHSPALYILMDKVLSYLSDATWTMLPSRKLSLINFSRPAKRSPNVLIPALDDNFCTQAMWSIKTSDESDSVSSDEDCYYGYQQSKI